jgi:Ca2+-binding EF-hand superfamily protein
MKKIVAVVGVMVVTSAFAHEGMHGPGAAFDKDGDGALSKEEFIAYLKASKEDVSQADAKFKALDTNADGKISSAEMTRGRAKQPAT